MSSEAVLVLAAFLRHQAQVKQAPVRPGEIGHVDLDVMAVVGRRSAAVSREHQRLAGADAHRGRTPRRRSRSRHAAANTSR